MKRQTIWDGKSLSEKLFSAILPSGPERAGTSKLQMLGLGKGGVLKQIMAKHNVETLPSLISLAPELGVRMIACRMAMSIIGIA
ncbi:MAG TPA: DsrE/DsrF/DrsH-like family protein [Candidatus Binataceae bacterium]|nr:DsrE/DsrF/DrsH-like family protein [Candidatus Binataceae bacterium]